MAGDWLKIEKATPRKPEILRIAAELGVHPDQAFGVCFRFWCWCDDNLKDGNAVGVTDVMLNALLERDGIATALINVGWLRVRNGSLEVPNYDRHLSENAKKRGLSQQRTAKSRSRLCNGASVTDALPEKRREEKSNKRKVIKEKSVRDNPPTVEEVRAHMLSQGKVDCSEEFHAYYSTNGWVQGKSSKPIVNWKAAVTNWFVQRKKFDREPLFARSEKSDPMYRPMTEVLAKEARCG